LLAASLLAALPAAPARSAAIAEIGEAFLGLSVGQGVIGGSLVTPLAGEIGLSLTATPMVITEARSGDGHVSHDAVVTERQGRASAAVTAAARTGSSGAALLDLAVTLTATLSNSGARSFDSLLVMLAFSAVAPTTGPALSSAFGGLAQPFAASGQTIALALDTTRETARAASRVSGPQAGDAHACTTEAAASPGGAIVVDALAPSGRTCGVANADVSEDFLLLADFSPGETQDFTWTIGITVEAFTQGTLTAVPEPAALGLLGLGALGLAVARRHCLTGGARAS
jgi:hypothetical protein